MRLSEHNVKTFKKAAVRVASALNAAGIGCELESPVLREGEFTSEGRQKFYSVDVAVKDPRYETVAIELEGLGERVEGRHREGRVPPGSRLCRCLALPEQQALGGCDRRPEEGLSEGWRCALGP